MEDVLKLNIKLYWIVLFVFANISLFGQNKIVAHCADYAIQNNKELFFQEYIKLKFNKRYNRNTNKLISYYLANAYFKNADSLFEIKSKIQPYSYLTNDALQKLKSDFNIIINRFNMYSNICENVKNRKQLKKLNKFKICTGLSNYKDTLQIFYSKLINELENRRLDSMRITDSLKLESNIRNKEKEELAKYKLKDGVSSILNDNITKLLKKYNTQFPCMFTITHKFNDNKLLINLLYPDSSNTLHNQDTDGFVLNKNKCNDRIENGNLNGVGYESKKYTKLESNIVSELLYEIFKCLNTLKINNQPVFLLSQIKMNCEGGADGRSLENKIYTGEFGTLKNVEFEDKSFNTKVFFHSIDSLKIGDKINNELLAYLRAYNEFYNFKKIMNKEVFLFDSIKINADFSIFIGPKVDLPKYRFCNLRIEFQGAFNYDYLKDERVLKHILETSPEDRHFFIK